MLLVSLAAPDDLAGFRAAVRQLVGSGTDPDQVRWTVAGEPSDMLDSSAAPLEAKTDSPELRVPRAFADLAARVICHRDPARFQLLHRAVLKLRSQPGLLQDRADPLVDRLMELEKSVGRDMHKMRAFVRFREIADSEGPHFIAWFEPEHHIVGANSGFFIRRYASQRWTILTPLSSAHWDGSALHMLPGATRADAPDGDPLEEMWKTYFASTFNPARLKIAAMQSEMPKKYWKNMPEAELIPSLIAGATSRVQTMIDDGKPVEAASLPALAEAAAACTRCPLHGPATRVVFGEGPGDARLMIVGEQPGDREDLTGRPFVGPAGQLLDRALAEAGIDRTRAYVTNAVKHFKFQLRGKRRIHESPNAGEIQACRWWLDGERSLLQPGLVLMLGASAGRALLGRAVAVGKERGRVISLPDGSPAFLTVHPSYLLRIEDPQAAKDEYARFVTDLAAARVQADA